jgi:hypothetical protein
MSVMDMNSRMAMAEKLSVQQLQQAVQSGSLPAYIGIPLIEQKTKEKAQMAAAQGGQQKPPSVAASILQQADQQEQQERGIDELPSNLPMMEDEEMGMAGGGIIAFAEGDIVEEDRRSPADKAMDEVIARIMRNPSFNQTIPPTTNTGEAGGVTELFPVDIGVSPEFGGVSSEEPRSFAPGAFSEKQRERVKAAKAAEEEARKQAFLRRVAPDQAASPTSPSFGMADMGATAGTTYTPPPKGAGDVGTGQGTQGAGGTPTARQAAPTAQAPAAQPEGQSALDKYAAMLMAEREGSGKERDKAKGMAILQAGLGIMGGTSPNAFANIAQGALPATQAYQQEIKGIRREDAARLKELMGLGVSKEKLALEAKKLGISEKRFDQMYQLEQQKIGIMGGSRADSRAQAEELKRLSVAQGLFATLRKDQLMSGLSDEQLWGQAQRMAGQAGAEPSASSSSVMGTYVPGKGYVPNK